jgi:hypothetical protein
MDRYSGTAWVGRLGLVVDHRSRVEEGELFSYIDTYSLALQYLMCVEAHVILFHQGAVYIPMYSLKV